MKNVLTIEDIEACGINPKSRPDNLSNDDYIALANRVTSDEHK